MTSLIGRIFVVTSVIRVSALALVFLLWPVPPTLEAGAALSMTVTPTAAFAPSNMRVRFRIEPSASNRALMIVADSMEFYRSSVVQLDGERAARLMIFEYHTLPAGEYEIRGSLLDSSGHERASVRQMARIIPDDGS